MACMAPDMLKNISYRPFIQNMSDWFSENPLIIQININVEKSFHHQANVKKFTFEMENTVQAGDPLNRIQQCLILPMLWASSNTTSIQFSLCVFVWGKQTSSLRWSFDRFFLHCPRNQWYLVLCLKCRQCVCACVCVCVCLFIRALVMARGRNGHFKVDKNSACVSYVLSLMAALRKWSGIFHFPVY